jgi:hypothetical protein
MALTAIACDMTSAGNYDCDSESEPRHPVGTSNGNKSGESGPIGTGASIIALMFLTWAIRL